MSKSTPISNLPNLKKQGEPAYEQRENEIVKEILNEIDNTSGKQPPAMGAQQGPSEEQVQQQMAQQQVQQQVQQQMMEQQMMEQQMMEQQQQQMMEQQQQQMMAGTPTPSTEVAKAPQSFVEGLIEKLKPSLIVAAIVALLSLPVISTSLNKILSSKEALKKFAMPITLAVKGLLGGALFFGVNNAGVL